jgi:hypothetical protein
VVSLEISAINSCHPITGLCYKLRVVLCVARFSHKYNVMFVLTLMFFVEGCALSMLFVFNNLVSSMISM